MGGSAGAGTSLRLAFHDDLADPGNADPVLRESSRLTAATAAQATYDVLRWKEFLGEAAVQAAGGTHVPAFYGLKTMEQLNGPEGRKIRADADMPGLITREDPPVLLIASSEHDALKTRGAGHPQDHRRAAGRIRGRQPAHVSVEATRRSPIIGPFESVWGYDVAFLSMLRH